MKGCFTQIYSSKNACTQYLVQHCNAYTHTHTHIVCYLSLVKSCLDLRKEIELLRSQLTTQGGAGSLGAWSSHSPANSHEEVKKLEEKLREYEKLMAEMSRSWSERLERTEQRKLEEAEELQVSISREAKLVCDQSAERIPPLVLGYFLQRAGMSFKVDNRLPNLVNLNDDPQLSEMLLYLLKEGL